MRQRGRKSADQLAIVRLDPADHYPAPASLGPVEAAEWSAIMARMPPGWFGRENFTLLSSYCRHAAEIERLSAMLAELDKALAQEVAEGRPEVEVICESSRARGRLLTMRDKETRAASSLATRLRLTPQSAYDKVKAGAAQKRNGPAPWEPQ